MKITKQDLRELNNRFPPRRKIKKAKLIDPNYVLPSQRKP
jgi:hypothetical protein